MERYHYSECIAQTPDHCKKGIECNCRKGSLINVILQNSRVFDFLKIFFYKIKRPLLLKLKIVYSIYSQFLFLLFLFWELRLGFSMILQVTITILHDHISQ